MIFRPSRGFVAWLWTAILIAAGAGGAQAAFSPAPMTVLIHRTSTSAAVPPLVIGSRTHAGALDPTFGNAGKVITSVSANRVGDVALQSDGKIVVAATIDNFVIATETFGIFRYLPNGKLDTNFGQGGVVLTAFTNFINIANAIAIQADGKIVVVGETQSADGKVDDFAVARYNPNGSLDRGFGHNGLVTADFFGFRDDADVVVVQPDRKIIVGGLAGRGVEKPDALALARYNANGTPDATFGKNGKVTAQTGNVNALALRNDGKILVLDATFAEQFFENGARDPSLTGGRIIAAAHTGISTFTPDGKILAALAPLEFGRRDVDVMLTRLMLDGARDAGFHSPTFDFDVEGLNAANEAQAVDVAPDGKLVAGGFADTRDRGESFGVARFNPNGSLDATFGNGGKVTTRFFNNSDMIDALRVQSDCKVVVVGTTFDAHANQNKLALTRYLAR